ncbi:FAD-dependent monooxygenase [Kribbella sp.]|uniref:FAD-dependent monooxygenase n=1 Tax=Kribbella sp. TaxID=1871183 RepID=UPI002D6F8E91|nr:FAD-dependent monooxygenase [Kribbella sp.]HZX07470.1 FAD-dependent monooxygenase [Kribbella sp.]
MDTDVVIAGAGPNGLMLASELGLAGVRPIVLERLPERNTVPRANGLVGQVVRMLDRRGLYERLSSTPGAPRPTPGYVFGAMPLHLELLAENPIYTLPVPQARIEEVLQERALEVGAELRRGHELLGFTQDADGAAVSLSGPDGEYQLRTRYLVGADGAHSQTRKQAGIDFPGVTNDSMVSRTGSASVPPEWVEGGMLKIPGYGAVPPFLHQRTERGLFVWAPFPGRLPAINTGEWDTPPDGEMTFEELQASVDRVLGVHLPLAVPTGDGVRQLRRVVGGNSRLASSFRSGRVFLVGDAAHVHSAIGGPGLNLGLQDVVNLGWKLAAEVRGWAPPGLLDTYEAERRPVGERVLMLAQAQSALVAPGNDVTALRKLFAEFLNDSGNVQRIADLMSGADIRYAAGAHPLVGRWAPDLQVGDVRLADLMRSARPLLVDLTPSGAFAGTRVPQQVDVHSGQGEQTLALLIRPDGYVAWAAEQDGDAERDGLREALEQWFQPRPLTSATR